MLFGILRETKNTVLYQELRDDGTPAEDDARIGTIYLKKSFARSLQSGFPPRITVAVTVAAVVEAPKAEAL